MAQDKPRALILEDTELGRWALTHALEAEGFEVESVSAWPDASARLLAARFSLVLAAVSSAPGNVAEVAGSVHRACPQARLVLLTDQDSVGELRLACGPEPDILTKPFDLAALARIAIARSGSPHRSWEVPNH